VFLNDNFNPEHCVGLNSPGRDPVTDRSKILTKAKPSSLVGLPNDKLFWMLSAFMIEIF
jgi:hypothetical protein